MTPKISRPRVAFVSLLALWIGFESIAIAQAPPVQQAAAQAPAFQRLAITTGRSMVLIADFDVTRIAITNPAIADATVVQPREILIDGKAPGTISLILWGGAGQRVHRRTNAG